MGYCTGYCLTCLPLKLWWQSASPAFVAIVFDISDATSFNSVPQWLERARSLQANVPVVLLGNKCDLEQQRVIDAAEAATFAAQHGLSYFEVSAVSRSHT